MGNAGHRAARGAALLLVGLAVAACIGGDNPGYQVIVGNKSTADLIVVMEGVGIGLPDLGGTPRKAFSVPAGTPAIAGPWVYVGFDTTGAQKPGHIRLYTSDCQAVTDFEVRGGTYALSIDEAGAASIAPYGRSEFPEGTPKLTFAPRDCP